MRSFNQLSEQEQNALISAHEQGKTIELFNANMNVWLITYRPTFEPHLVYRVAEQQAENIISINKG